MTRVHLGLTLLATVAILAASCAVNEAGVDKGGAGEPRPGEVRMCDNETTVAIQEGTKTREEGQKIADALMEQWRRKNPGAGWEQEVRERHKIVPPADNSDLAAAPGAGGQAAGHAYGQFTRREVEIWQRETERFVLEGARVFHSGDELGSTIAVSCDMCHPDASNTHPETYPKFQTQMGRVVLLRDMINWCLEHPVRAKPLQPDDPRMRAMEAYILGQRKGTPLNYGRH